MQSKQLKYERLKFTITSKYKLKKTKTLTQYNRYNNVVLKDPIYLCQQNLLL